MLSLVSLAMVAAVSRKWLCGLPVLVLSVLAAPLASAAEAAYAEWDLDNGQGTVTVPGSLTGAFATDASSVTTPAGAGTYLGAGTPFGQDFGSSRGHAYVVIRPATGGKPSTTTITFATPASNWGFALGDVDAETVQVSATGPDGNPVDVGYQGAFNYCATTPKPSSCGSAPATDLPTWNAGTLRGNGPDTAGASGWFRPAKPIASLTLRMTVLTGKPVYQLWIAAHPTPPPTTTTTGTTTATTTTTPEPTTTPGPTTTTHEVVAQPRPKPPTAEPLPATGTPVGPWVGVGALLVLGGAALIHLAARRRRAG